VALHEKLILKLRSIAKMAPIAGSASRAGCGIFGGLQAA